MGKAPVHGGPTNWSAGQKFSITELSSDPSPDRPVRTLDQVNRGQTQYMSKSSQGKFATQHLTPKSSIGL